LKKAKQDVESIAESPEPSGQTTKRPQATEQRVANASARLDDALKTVREEGTPTTKTADHHKDSNPQ
jgi:sec-independent protein translocase protein TatB